MLHRFLSEKKNVSFIFFIYNHCIELIFSKQHDCAFGFHVRYVHRILELNTSFIWKLKFHFFTHFYTDFFFKSAYGIVEKLAHKNSFKKFLMKMISLKSNCISWVISYFEFDSSSMPIHDFFLISWRINVEMNETYIGKCVFWH